MTNAFDAEDSSSHSEAELGCPTTYQAPVALVPAVTSPEVVRPYPKAPPKKSDVIKQKRGKFQVLTDTLVKNDLIEELSAQKKEKIAKAVFSGMRNTSK